MQYIKILNLSIENLVCCFCRYERGKNFKELRGGTDVLGNGLAETGKIFFTETQKF